MPSFQFHTVSSFGLHLTAFITGVEQRVICQYYLSGFLNRSPWNLPSSCKPLFVFSPPWGGNHENTPLAVSPTE